jgi:hypothetical protein
VQTSSHAFILKFFVYDVWIPEEAHAPSGTSDYICGGGKGEGAGMSHAVRSDTCDGMSTKFEEPSEYEITSKLI